MAGTSNYTPQYLWEIITCPCPWYLLLAHKSSYGVSYTLWGQWGIVLGMPSGTMKYRTHLAWPSFVECGKKYSAEYPCGYHEYLEYQQIEANTKWPPFSKRHFEKDFLNVWISVDICSNGSNWQYSSIGSDHGFVPTRRQAIIWTNNG